MKGKRMKVNEEKESELPEADVEGRTRLVKEGAGTYTSRASFILSSIPNA